MIEQKGLLTLLNKINLEANLSLLEDYQLEGSQELLKVACEVVAKMLLKIHPEYLGDALTEAARNRGYEETESFLGTFTNTELLEYIISDRGEASAVIDMAISDLDMVPLSYLKSNSNKLSLEDRRHFILELLGCYNTSIANPEDIKTNIKKLFDI